MSVSTILLILAVICFVFAAFGFAPIASLTLGWLGLAFFAGAFIPK